MVELLLRTVLGLGGRVSAGLSGEHDATEPVVAGEKALCVQHSFK